MKKDFDCTGKEYAPFLTFDLSGWKPVIQALSPEKVEKGTVICRHYGEDGNVVLVEKGLVTMSFINADGSEHIHFLGSTGYVFGFRSCLSGRPYGGTLSALSDVSLYKIPSHIVRTAMQESNEFFELAMYGEYERGLAYSRKLELLALSNNTTRIAALFLSLGDKIGTKKGGVTIIPIRLTHDLIAKIIYSDRVTVSRVISQFEKQGILVKSDGLFSLLDPDRLRSYLQ